MAPVLKAIPGGVSGASTTATETPYEFAPEFLRALIYLCVKDPEVYGRIGALMSPKLLGSSEAQLVLSAAHAIAEDTGAGPSQPALVMQRLAAWRTQGKVTTEQMSAVDAYLCAAEDAGLPPSEQVVTEASIVVQRVMGKSFVEQTLSTHAKRGDYGELAKQADKVASVGRAKHTLGSRISESDFDIFLAEGRIPKLPTGCTELDRLLEGGLPRGLTLFIGREKAGKSMVLSSLAAESWISGKNVAVATLELNESAQKMRILANVLNVPISDLTKQTSDYARERFSQIKDRLGQLWVQYFSADTSVKDVLFWVEKLNETQTRKIDLLVVDYIDQVAAGHRGEDESAYKAQKMVNNRFRDHALKHGYVCVSASQARRDAGASKQLDNHDVADSAHKVRIPDLVIAMRMEQDNQDFVDYFVSASRFGASRSGTGPLPANRAVGRMWPVMRDEMW